MERVLPVVTEQGLADFCDVFLESSVFNVPQSRKLLLAAQKLGLPSKVHADEIDPLGGSELAGEIGAISAEHLIATRDSGIEAMAKAKTTACLLPQTSLYLNKPFAPYGLRRLGHGPDCAVPPVPWEPADPAGGTGGVLCRQRRRCNDIPDITWQIQI